MVPRTMRKSIFIILLSVSTLIALAVVWFWALGPLLIPLNSINPTEFTSADVVRRVWHLRLVQPEWVSNPTDYVRWSQAESLARFIVVVLGWLVGVAFIIRGRLASHRGAPTDTAPQPMAATH